MTHSSLSGAHEALPSTMYTTLVATTSLLLQNIYSFSRADTRYRFPHY
jgi:hypothetical protein